MSKKDKPIRAKLIANPGSGKMEGNTYLEQVTRGLQDEGYKVDVVLAKPNEKAVPLAKQAVKDGYKVIIAMGGDDCIWAVMRGIVGSKGKVRLGIIPAGTENNVAVSLGIPADADGACAVIAQGHVRKVDVGQVKTKQGKKVIFFEVVSIGIGSSLYEDVKKVPKGDLSGIKDAVMTVIKHPTLPKVTLTLDDESDITIKTMAVNVSNMPIMGAHMLVAPDASVEDGVLDISVYPEFSKPQLLRYFAQVREEGRETESKVQRYRAQKIKIKSKPKMRVLADGLLLGKGTIKIKVLPRAIRVFAPEVGTGVEAPPKAEAQDLPAPVAPAVTGPDGAAAAK